MDTLFRRSVILRRLANEAYVLRRCYEQAGRDMGDPQVANVLAENEEHLARVLIEALLAFDITPASLSPEQAERLMTQWSPAQVVLPLSNRGDRRRRRELATMHAESAESAQQSDAPRIIGLHVAGSWQPTDDALDLPIRESGMDDDGHRLDVTFDLDSPYARYALLHQLREWLSRLEADEPEEQREEDRRAREFDRDLERWLAPEVEGAE